MSFRNFRGPLVGIMFALVMIANMMFGGIAANSLGLHAQATAQAPRIAAAQQDPPQPTIKQIGDEEESNTIARTHVQVEGLEFDFYTPLMSGGYPRLVMENVHGSGIITGTVSSEGYPTINVNEQIRPAAYPGIKLGEFKNLPYDTGKVAFDLFINGIPFPHYTLIHKHAPVHPWGRFPWFPSLCNVEVGVRDDPGARVKLDGTIVKQGWYSETPVTIGSWNVMDGDHILIVETFKPRNGKPQWDKINQTLTISWTAVGCNPPTQVPPTATSTTIPPTVTSTPPTTTTTTVPPTATSTTIPPTVTSTPPTTTTTTLPTPTTSVPPTPTEVLPPPPVQTNPEFSDRVLCQTLPASSDLGMVRYTLLNSEAGADSFSVLSGRATMDHQTYYDFNGREFGADPRIIGNDHEFEVSLNVNITVGERTYSRVEIHGVHTFNPNDESTWRWFDGVAENGRVYPAASDDAMTAIRDSIARCKAPEKPPVKTFTSVCTGYGPNGPINTPFEDGSQDLTDAQKRLADHPEICQPTPKTPNDVPSICVKLTTGKTAIVKVDAIPEGADLGANACGAAEYELPTTLPKTGESDGPISTLLLIVLVLLAAGFTLRRKAMA